MRAADGKPGMHAFAFKSAFGKSALANQHWQISIDQTSIGQTRIV
jgi:hypothetical protein